jgi:hypothetical protein
LYKAESVLKIRLYLLDVGTFVIFTVSFENYCVIVWEYAGRNGKAFRDWKSSKIKMFQAPEN